MNYYELSFILTDAEDFHSDLLINALSEANFDTFEETTHGFNAYIAENLYNESLIDEVICPYRDMIKFSYTKTFIPQKNWNEVWESNFDPIQVSDQVYIRATFHPQKENFPYEIIIDPKMSFGTGHHQTTMLMMEWLLQSDLKNKIILDMGCGTAILGILASKLGASSVDAIDYDEVCYISAKENAALNDINNLTAYCGSKEVIPNKKYHTILANINRNILLDQMQSYADVLEKDGELYLSGFYEADLDVLISEAEKFGLKYIEHKKLNEWVSAKLVL